MANGKKQLKDMKLTVDRYEISAMPSCLHITKWLLVKHMFVL